MKHQIDPTVDCVFKAILGKEDNKNLLIHFLNAILRRAGTRRIVDVVIANPYNEREFVRDKLGIVDVKAVDRQGRHYQIEIQRAIHGGLAARMVFTWSAMYHAQLNQGNHFLRLRPVIAIWLLRTPMFPEVKVCHLPFGLYNPTHRLQLSDHLAIHLVQFSQWQLTKQHPDARDRWLYFLKHGKHLDPTHPPDILQTKEMKQAMSVLAEFSEREKNYLLYEQRLEAERVELTWRELLKQANAALEQERREKERERREKERLLLEKEREHQEKEREQQKREEEKRLLLEKEQQLLQELEHLQTLLRKSGINPAQAE